MERTSEQRNRLPYCLIKDRKRNYFFKSKHFLLFIVYQC